MKAKILSSLVFVLAAAVAGAAPVSIGWQASGKNYSGSFTNSAHWSRGTYAKPYPQDGSYAYIRPGVHHTVTFPVGAFTNAADFKILAYNGCSTTLSGEETDWVLPTVSTSDNYLMAQSASFMDAGGLMLGHGEPGNSTSGRCRLANFDICLTNDNAGSSLLDIRKGTINYYDGTGTPYTGTWIHFLQTGNSYGTVRFGAGTCSKFAGARFNFLNSKASVLDFAGGTHEFKNSVQFPNSGMGFNADVASLWNIKVRNGATLKFNSLMIGGSGSKGSTGRKTIRIEADAGTIDLGSTDFSMRSCGHQELQLRNGSTFTARRFYAGEEGTVTGRVEVSSGSTLTCERFYLGPTAAADALIGRCDLAVTNGTVDLSNVNPSYLAFNSCTVTLADGGRLIAPKLPAGSGAGQNRVHFVADGGTLVPTAAESAYFSGFDTARLEAGGLTLETPYNLTVGQNFTGTGPLTLKGNGVVTLTGTQAGLRLGSGSTAGTLKVASGSTFACAGDIDIVSARLVFTGSFPVSATPYVIATTPGTVTGAEAWTNAVIVSGISSAVATDFGVDKQGDLTRLLLTVRDPLVHEENLASGTEMRAGDIVLNPQDELSSTVDSDAKLTLSGKLVARWLKKYGAGALTVSNPDNEFGYGFTLNAGLLSFTEPAALGYAGGDVASVLAGGTLELKSSVSPATVSSPIAVKGAVVIKADADITMPLPTMTSGSLIKRGAGRLVFNVGGNASLEGLSNSGSFSAGYSYAFDDQGTVPNLARGAVNVVEGDLVFRGTTATPPTLTSAKNSTRTLVVGLATSTPSTDPAAPAALVFDHVTLDHSRSWALFYPQPYVTAAGQSAIPSCSVVVSNGATLKLDHVNFNQSCKLSGPTTTLRLDNGTFDLGGYFYPNENINSVGSAPGNHIYMSNGSDLRAGRVMFTGNTTIDVDASTFQGYGGAVGEVRLGGDRAANVNFNFRNGALFRCQGLVYQSVTATEVSGAQFCLAFDDAEWFAGDANRNIASSNLNVRLELSGKGVTFAPPTGRTWRLHTRTTGTGGLVKKGAGTLRIVCQEKYCKKTADPLTYAATGSLDVQAGTLALEPGAIRDGLSYSAALGATVDFGGGAYTNVTLAGDGTYVNGTVTDATVAVPYGTTAAPTLGAGLVLEGPVTLDFADEGETVVRERTVLRYTGTAPDISTWKVKRGSLPRGYTAQLSLDTEAKAVKASVAFRGFMMILR